MSSWEQDITELLNEAQSIAVRFDIEQDLTAAEKQRARNNIGVSSSATAVTGEDYVITTSY